MKVNIYCNISGPLFSPSMAESKTGISLINKNEPGEIASMGLFRCKPLPCGDGQLVPDGSAELPYGGRFEQLVGTIEKHIEELKQCGATEFLLSMDVCYDSQCNLEFTPSEMGRISRLGIPLAISCYSGEE